MYVAVALLAALLLGNIATQIAAHRDEKSQPEIQVVVHTKAHPEGVVIPPPDVNKILKDADTHK